MRKILGLLGLFFLTVTSSDVYAAEIQKADFIFDHVNVVPMTRETVLSDRSVIVRDGKIVGITDIHTSALYTSAKHIDGRGRYLMPGLSDMHVHLRMPPQDFFDLNLAQGVTTIFNMGIADGGGKIDHLALRAGIAAGTMDGPRYLVSGPQLDSSNVSMSTVDQVLQEHVERGYDAVKIHGDLSPELYDAIISGARARGLRIRGHGQHMMPLAQTLRMDSVEHVEELLYISQDAALGEEAKFGVEADGNIDNFLTAYYHNISRLQDHAYRAGVVTQIAQSGVYWDPTMVIYSMIPIYVSDDRFHALASDSRLQYLPDGIRRESLDNDKNEYRAGLVPVFSKFLLSIGDHTTVEHHFDQNMDMLLTLTRELHDAGVPLLIGSDVFGALVPGYAQHQEMELFVKAGLTPYETLQAATVNGAKYLGEFGQAGTIEVGKRADFILLGGNPLVDIRNAADVRGVFTHGKWHSEEDLAMRLSRVANDAANN
ncbi:amidohydrolase family protein [Asticcacaulis taihuensis]|jgi:imidazolonepropionase-like amidohydrolase|uniref:Amidohydrolase family protein n=1 Tax=Asticcacaulis taihuensis TaxID=260084 RepID=A0A1G4SHA1_9CAUL|nr:amidohydrolase family protein [Asticcacaulis taihuensis]SCW68431.1 Amidohydrolase family protein [Asticcacaulis taihuensis]